jgi:hypothetical protein
VDEAAARTGELEPTPDAVRAALREVVGRCIYGVDVNPMAAELAKVTLWLEAMEPGRPLAFLDPNIRVGNSLLGVTPKLLADGIPDGAYKPLEGDDRKVVAALKRQNKEERTGQDDLFATAGVPVANVALAKQTEAIAHADLPRSLADVHVQERRNRDLEPERRRLGRVADAWCAAFVQPKTDQTRLVAITQATLERLHRGDSGAELEAVREAVEDLARDYRFFHWHLEFPHIFRVPEANHVDPGTGWTGGFTCVIGNPPWERVKLQEQEFFGSRDEKIAKAANAAERKGLIAALDGTDPVLAAEWHAAQRRSDGVSHLLRDSGRYPLCGVGDINTYSVFAEHFRTVIAAAGRMGIVTPTGAGHRRHHRCLLRRHPAGQPADRVLRLRERSQDLPERSQPVPVRAHLPDRWRAGRPGTPGLRRPARPRPTESAVRCSGSLPPPSSQAECHR